MPSLLASHQHLLGFVVLAGRMCVWLVLLTAVFAPLERFFSIRPAKLFHKGWATNLGWYFVNGLTPVFLLGPPSALIAAAVHAGLPASITSAGAALPLWARMIAAMVVGEIGFYWGHRWSHQIPLLWRFHAVHHSAERIDWLVNTRAHPIDMIFTRLCGLVPLYVLGLAAPTTGEASVVPVAVLLVGIVWGFFIHANLRWRFGPLEWLVATPGFHHWHHTNDSKDVVDKNYAAMLPVMDWLFGSLHLPATGLPVRYGTDHPMPAGFVDQLLEPFMPENMPPQAPPRTPLPRAGEVAERNDRG